MTILNIIFRHFYGLCGQYYGILDFWDDFFDCLDAFNTICYTNSIIKTNESKIKGQIIELKQAKNSENSLKNAFLNGCKMAKIYHSEYFWVQKWSPQCWKLIIMKKKLWKKKSQKKAKMPKMALFCALHFSTEQNICFGHIVRRLVFKQFNVSK